MRLFLFVLFILPLLAIGTIPPIRFRQGMQDRFEQHVGPGSYNNLLDYSKEIEMEQSNNQRSGINIAELLRFFSLLDQANEKFETNMKRKHPETFSKVSKVRLYYRSPPFWTYLG